MNPTDLIIGLGLGILIAVIFRAVADAIKSKLEKRAKEKKHRTAWYSCVDSDVNTLKHNLRIVIKRIDQHAGRIEKLEAKKK